MQMISWQFTPYAWLYLLAVGVSFLLTYMAWKMRPVRGATVFSLMTFSTTIWSLGYLLGFFNKNPGWKLIMLRVEYLGAIGAVTLWVIFVAAYTNYSQLLRPKALIIIGIVPAITLLLISTMQYHNLFYLSYRFISNNGLIVSEKIYGAGFYLWIAFSYSMMILGVGVLIRGMVNMPERFRQQIVLLVAVIAIVIIPNYFYISGVNPITPYDPTCLTFVLVGLLLIITMRHYRFLDVVPVAHNLVFNSVNCGVIIFDERRHIQEMNPAAEKILNTKQENILGKPFARAFPDQKSLINCLREISEIKTEINIEDKGYFEIQASPIYDLQNRSQGLILMLYDFTARKQAEDELHRQAITDPLTEVLNRRHFFSLAEPIFRQAIRYERELAVLMIDLDHFKQVNDSFGHNIGDQVLISLAKYLQNHIRSADILARYGGEEFVILMPETQIESPAHVAERLRELISKNSTQTDIGPVNQTISIGVATLDKKKDPTIDKLIDRADQAMYTAKQTGRNRVIIHEEISNSTDYE